MLSMILTLALAPAPAGDDRSPAEAPTAVEAWTPAPADAPAPEPAPEPATPMPLPMPVPAPAPGAQVGGPPAPPPAGDPPPPPPTRRRTWPDRPIAWRLDLGGELGTSVFRDPAWRIFDPDDRGVFQLGATIRGDARLGGGRVFLGGGATFRRFGSGGFIYDYSISSDIRVREPLAFLRLSVVTVEGADVFFQAGGGPSFAELGVNTIGDDYYGSYNSQWQNAILGMADAQAGVALYLPKKWLPRRGASRVTGGLELSAGYTFRTRIKVRPELLTDDDPIATHSATLGDVAARGFTWRLGLFIRFQ